MYKLNLDEKTKLDGSKNHDIVDLIRTILCREIAVQHKYLETDMNKDSLFVTKGRCEAIRVLNDLLKTDEQKLIRDDSDIQKFDSVSEDKKPAKKVKVGFIKKILNLFKGNRTPQERPD